MLRAVGIAVDVELSDGAKGDHDIQSVKGSTPIECTSMPKLLDQQDEILGKITAYGYEGESTILPIGLEREGENVENTQGDVANSSLNMGKRIRFEA